ncbi:hydrogen gas-evolving membrane-bound hydrogenase subunit E [Aliiruegeria sabulilitoris]|uniref:hydrogen gas-evolving membrane-bound hydrogenase subunit E n=1 Tax=Aliiruegeria sabulilitoris TaxID=1510458 RepID=UPI00083764CC|nr:hydrogen gas-evolving membrane-bound hydrogenase subunit E [Aliiruegeria sabulilitoris]NDR57718.1 sodium:proton antiporter [Pseudoruegeria sp. M32A2M]
MIRKVVIGLMVALLGVAFWTLTSGYVPDAELNRTAAYYAANAESEVGAPNIVTGIIVTWRGLDTLGEVTVLFLTSAIIALVLSQSKTPKGASGAGLLPSGELLVTGARMLAPLIALFGAYVIMNGHLTPGGGFQGGAILASGVLLSLLAEPSRRFGHTVIARIESFSGTFYVLVGLAGMAYAGGFLDNGILPLGQFGTMLSAGAIPLISILIGLKVGAEFSSILESLHETEDA